MTPALFILASLVLLHMASLAEQWGARTVARKGAIYWKVAEDEQGDVWVRYVGKSKRPAARQSGHKAKAVRDNETWRLGDMIPFRFCWTARQEARIERRRILALAAFYRCRKAIFPRKLSRLENVVLNRKPRSLAEYVTVYAALACYLVESFVYRPSRTWASPRRTKLPVASFAEVVQPLPVERPGLPAPTVVGPGRDGPRFALPSGVWSVDAESVAVPVSHIPPPPPVPVGLTPSVSSPAVAIVPRLAGEVPSMPAPGPSSVGLPVATLPPPPPVPTKAKRPRRPRPANTGPVQP